MNNKVKCLTRVRDEEGYQRVGRINRDISGEKGGFGQMGEIERDFW
jgi:hypothetical protein